MTMQDKIEAIKQVQDYEDDIKDKLEIVIRHTYDPDCNEVIGFTVDDGTVNARYICRFYDDLVFSCEKIPAEWLSEDFDYEAAYREMKRKEAEEAEKKLKAEQKTESCF